MYEDETEMKPASSGGGGLGRAVKNLFLLILFVALAFGLLYLVAERNARRYFLVPEGGNLVVKRGIFFPIGEKPYLPDDPGLAAAYAPIPLPADGAKAGPEDFDERSDLDRKLFDQLLTWSKPRIHSGDSKTMEKGIYYLRRAEKLPTYTEAQRTTLEELQGEVSYYEAKRRLSDAVETLEGVALKLKRARDSGSARANESQALLAAIQSHVEALRGILNQLKGGGTLPLPETGGGAAQAGTPAPTPGAPAPAQGGTSGTAPSGAAGASGSTGVPTRPRAPAPAPRTRQAPAQAPERHVAPPATRPPGATAPATARPPAAAAPAAPAPAGGN